MRISDGSSDVCSSDLGWMSRAEIAETYEEIGRALARQAEAAILRPKITTPAHVMQSVIPPKREVARPNTPSDEDRKAMFGSDAGQMDKPMHMARSEEHTSELQSLMRNSYAVFCLTNKNKNTIYTYTTTKQHHTKNQG